MLEEDRLLCGSTKAPKESACRVGRATVEEASAIMVKGVMMIIGFEEPTSSQRGAVTRIVGLRSKKSKGGPAAPYL